MKITTRSVTTSLIALLVGMSCIPMQAEARRGGGHAHARAHVAAHNVGRVNGARVVNRHRVANHHYYRRGRWVNGVWVAGAVATGVAVGASAARNNCSYYWNRWKATGSTYWHDRYKTYCD